MHSRQLQMQAFHMSCSQRRATEGAQVDTQENVHQQSYAQTYALMPKWADAASQLQISHLVHVVLVPLQLLLLLAPAITPPTLQPLQSPLPSG